MNTEDLLQRLNGYPMWTELDARNRGDVYQTVRELCRVYQEGDREERISITERLNRAAKYLMFQYSREHAAETRRTGSRQTLLEGLIPVVMAGGRSDNATGGILLSMILRSAECAGLDTQEIFSYASRFAADDEARRQICEFPLLPQEMRGIERFGVTERKTPEGVVYELPDERDSRPRWWDKLTGRRRVTREDVLRMLRKVETEQGWEK